MNFWNWVKCEANEERELYIGGIIAEESWWGDEVTPKLFRNDLNSGSGNITVWISSPGGDVDAASQIYTMLRSYTGGKVTVKIDGLAASAASVIAMAGVQVLMAPTAMMMIHEPSTIAWGNSDDMQKTKDMLKEYEESIINAYEAKTKITRAKLSQMMHDETWMSAGKAVEMGFADGILFKDGEKGDGTAANNYSFSSAAVMNSLIAKMRPKIPPKTPDNAGVPADYLYKRLNLLK